MRGRDLVRSGSCPGVSPGPVGARRELSVVHTGAIGASLGFIGRDPVVIPPVWTVGGGDSWGRAGVIGRNPSGHEEGPPR